MSGIAEVLHNSAIASRVPTRPTAPCAASAGKGHQRLHRHNGGKSRRCRGGGRLDGDQEGQPRAHRCREKFLPVVRRAEMLAELMRFRNAIAIGGTHGKTTTTSMVPPCFDAGGLDPTVINGGIINAYGTNARMAPANGWWSKPDESRRHVPEAAGRHRRSSPISSRTSRPLRQISTPCAAAFRQFVENVPFYGFGVLCLDHPGGPVHGRQDQDRKVVNPYGENPPGRRALPQYPHGRCDFHLRHRDPPPPRTGQVIAIKDLGCRCPTP